MDIIVKTCFVLDETTDMSTSHLLPSDNFNLPPRLHSILFGKLVLIKKISDKLVLVGF